VPSTTPIRAHLGRVIALSLAGLVFGAVTQSSMHALEVSHVACEHGDLVHVEAGAALVPQNFSSLRAGVELSHDHCEFLLAGSAATNHVHPSLVPADCLLPAVLVRGAQTERALIALLRVSPKTSPPRAHA